MAHTVVIIIHILVSIFLVTTILFQTGKGASMGASFGGGTQAVFGGSGPASLLMKITIACATIFMLTSLYLTYVSGRAGARSLMKDATPVIKTVPAPDAEAKEPATKVKPEAKVKAKPAAKTTKAATETRKATKAKPAAKATKTKAVPAKATPAPAH